MERNLISMAREIEQLRAEQMNADRRARGLGELSLSLHLFLSIFLLLSLGIRGLILGDF
jgi:hypothetical protein